jgi:ABC-type Fe3+/spermidine/putrescine transport system ATPase subunit
MIMPRLTLRGLTKVYGRQRVVDAVDLTLEECEFVSLLGPSGCGKTTTLRMIAGFVAPTEGAIEMDGRMLSSPASVTPPERRGMSMIFQSYAIWPNMTVAENVAFGLELRKLPAPEIKRRVGKVLDVVQMGALADRYPAELSGGQQQRVALARAIVVEPSVLLLDEPLSNLDANLREEMRFEIRRLHEALRITTVYVTHDQAEAMVTSDRVAVMNKGRIEQVDAPYMVYSRPKTRFVAGFIGRTNFVEARRNGSAIVFDGFAIETGRLEDIPATGETLTFSVRPQSLQLLREPVEDGKRVAIKGSIVQRSFLGEHWDYVFGPENSGLRLRVATQPSEVHDVGSAAWLAIDPKLMVAIA